MRKRVFPSPALAGAVSGEHLDDAGHCPWFRGPDGSHVQYAAVVVVPGADGGSVPEEDIADGQVGGRRWVAAGSQHGEMQRSKPPSVTGIHVRASLDKAPHDLRVTTLRRAVQRPIAAQAALGVK